ncbi:MAG: GHKL domain-containing protein [Coriobacteriaceae bacterium]|jgi:signal transduction histidine kinase|nr:GHKL domain-containing protein [Coriobacteriaceae bacterium]
MMTSLSNPGILVNFACLYVLFAAGVILINDIYAERIPRILPTAGVSLLMTAVLVPTVIVSTPLIAYVQLVLATSLLMLYIHLFINAQGKLSGHLFRLSGLVAFAVSVHYLMMLLCVRVSWAFALSDDIASVAGMLLTAGATVLAVSFIKKSRIYRFQESAPSSYLVGTTILLWTCMFAIILLLDNTSVLNSVLLYEHVKQNSHNAESIMVAGSAVMVLVFHIAYTQQIAHAKRLILKDGYMRLEESYIKDLESATNELRKLRHDLLNHMAVIDSLAQKGDTEAVSAHTAYLQSIMADAEAFVTTGNKAMDIILAAKLSVCKQKRHPFDLEVSGGGPVPVDSYSVVTIIGNLLDNAIEASDRVAGQGIEPHIDILLKKQGRNLLFNIQNVALAPISRKGVFLSQKEGPSHGLGLLQVRRRVSECDGLMDASFKPKDLSQEMGGTRHATTRDAGSPGRDKMPPVGTFAVQVILPLVDC